MPTFKKEVERICCMCFFYTINVGGKNAGAYCNKHKKNYPNAGAWAYPDKITKDGKQYKKPGERSCKFWRVK